jgi:Fur family transcriptional regulator, zinc uptake regulator
MGQSANHLTPNQAQVLDHLRAANAPMTAYQLLGRMQTDRGAVAPPTVYRALKGLEEAGLIRRIEDCGTVRGVEAPGLLESLHERLAAEGFADARQTIEVHGRCGDCAEDRA